MQAKHPTCLSDFNNLWKKEKQPEQATSANKPQKKVKQTKIDDHVKSIPTFQPITTQEQLDDAILVS